MQISRGVENNNFLLVEQKENDIAIVWVSGLLQE
jgi:hypothetical protein